jgi:DNA-binding MarR family transcriptional regulator
VIDKIVLQLTPWQAQIMLLPLRRPDPDTKRNNKTPAQAARADGSRLAADRAIAKTQADIIAVLRKMPGLCSSDVAKKIGRSSGYTHGIIRELLADEVLRRENGPRGTKPLYIVRKQKCR